MAIFGAKVSCLNNDEITRTLEWQWKNVEDEIILITPYFDIDKLGHLQQHLEDACKSVKKVRVLVRKEEGKGYSNSLLSLARFDNVEIRTLPNLHAKLYCADHTAIVASMNLYAASINNSFEFGVLFEDSTKDIFDYIEKIWNDSRTERLQPKQSISNSQSLTKTLSSTTSTKTKTVKSEEKVHTGFCIRCGTEIKHDLEKTLCYPCFKASAKFAEYPDAAKFCHTCHTPIKNDLDHPQCKPCWSASKK